MRAISDDLPEPSNPINGMIMFLSVDIGMFNYNNGIAQYISAMNRFHRNQIIKVAHYALANRNIPLLID
jgi:hypothetical protein